MEFHGENFVSIYNLTCFRPRFYASIQNKETVLGSNIHLQFPYIFNFDLGRQTASKCEDCRQTVCLCGTFTVSELEHFWPNVFWDKLNKYVFTRGI